MSNNANVSTKDVILKMTEYKIEVLRGHARPDGWILFNKATSLEEARKVAANAMLKTNYLAVRIV